MHHDQQAVDLLYSFQTGDESQRSYLEDLIKNGHVPEDEMKILTLHSSRRGFEEFVMLVSCANAMREKASFDDPLDGQDTLTFITKIIQLAGSSGEPSGNEAQTSPKHKEIPMQKPSGGRSTGRNKTDPGEVAKKRGKDHQSPFWSTPQAPAGLFMEQPEDDTKQRKKQEKQKSKDQRREKKAKMRKEVKTQKAVESEENFYSQDLPMRPALGEALQRRSNEAVDDPAVPLKRRHSQMARRL